MAPQQRKNAAGKAKEKDAKRDSKKETEEKKEPTFLEKHVLKIQLALLFVAFLTSVIPRLQQGHDRYRFEDSYKDPIAWHRHFAKEYVSLLDQWGYTLHVNVSRRLHGFLSDATGASVLDIGAGSGLVGVELQRLGVPHITALDVVPEILEEANATGAYENVIQADVEAVPLELVSASFDAVVCVAAAGYLGRGERDEHGPSLDHKREAKGPQAEASRVDNLLKEWLRLLKPGGVLALTAEVLLKDSWEEALRRLQQDGSVTHLDSIGPVDFLPNNSDRWTSEQTVFLYFYRKHE
jgi:SAM-dependent methyltransferase